MGNKAVKLDPNEPVTSMVSEDVVNFIDWRVAGEKAWKGLSYDVWTFGEAKKQATLKLHTNLTEKHGILMILYPIDPEHGAQPNTNIKHAVRTYLNARLKVLEKEEKRLRAEYDTTQGRFSVGAPLKARHVSSYKGMGFHASAHL